MNKIVITVGWLGVLVSAVALLRACPDEPCRGKIVTDGASYFLCE